MRIVIMAALLAAGLGAGVASAQDIGVGSCAGVRGVYVGPGGVSVGGAWVSPRDCVGPKQ